MALKYSLKRQELIDKIYWDTVHWGMTTQFQLQNRFHASGLEQREFDG